LSQQLASPADKWQPLFIFVGARTFSDEDEPRAFVSGSKNDIMATFAQPATPAIANVGENFF
jgi:hypothetical protein